MSLSIAKVFEPSENCVKFTIPKVAATNQKADYIKIQLDIVVQCTHTHTNTHIHTQCVYFAISERVV